MSTLQLLLELRARQIANIQADIHRQRRNALTVNAAILFDAKRIKSFDRGTGISFQDNSVTSTNTSVQAPNEWYDSDLMLRMLSSGATKHSTDTRVPQLVSNITLAASFAPTRAKRRSCNEGKGRLNTASANECNELQDKQKSDKNFSRWIEFYNILKEFQRRHGHCIVPRNCEVTKLACWVVQQRRQFRLFQDGIPSAIDQNRIKMLNEIGFTWDAQEASWERQMDELRSFHEKYGTSDVSRSDQTNRKLYRWIREQRRIFRDRNAIGQTGGLSKKRIAALESVGFAFDSVGGTFSSRLTELIDFHQKHKHCQVPRENDDLYQWSQRIRMQHQMKLDGKESVLQQRHIQALDKIGFRWTFDAANSNTEHFDEDSLVTSRSVASSSSIHTVSDSSKMESNDTHCTARPLKKRRVD